MAIPRVTYNRLSDVQSFIYANSEEEAHFQVRDVIRQRLRHAYNVNMKVFWQDKMTLQCTMTPSRIPVHRATVKRQHALNKGNPPLRYRAKSEEQVK